MAFEIAVTVVIIVSLIALGAYLEAKFGAKIEARVAALEAKVHADKSAVETKVAAVEAAAKK